MPQAPAPAATQPQTQKQALTGADILVLALVQQGAQFVFAYPGGASMPLHQALRLHREKIRTILPRHEQGEASPPRVSPHQ